MHATGPDPGPPPPCGVENVLCRFRCITSTPKSPGPHLAHQRIHVGAIHIKQRALGVQNVGDLVNLVLENSQRRRIRQHQRRRVFINLPRQRFEIDAAIGIRLQVLHLVAADGRRRGVGAMRRVGNQDLAARIALRLMPRAHQQNAGELAMRARCRLQRNRVHAGNVDAGSAAAGR